MGRTGFLFAYQDEGIIPHVVTLAKGLAGGVPIGALLFSEDVACGLPVGSHASTFGGNYLACVAGLVVLNTLLSQGFLEGVRRKGGLFAKLLRVVAEKTDLILDVRGRGLMVGVEFNDEISPTVVLQLMEAGVLTVPAGTRVVRFLPPLIISEDEIREVVARFGEVIRG
jgi:acetylornithine/succinyldiaminopimelate/putrescine aminotransferase